MKAGKGENCSKFSLSQYAPIIYVPKDGKEYAIAYREGANMMPLCFTTAKDDVFTLNFDTRGYNGSYLHLIDNATGTDIDLLSTPSYTFNSKDCVYATRFKLVFAEEATNDIVDSFAYLNNGEIVITGTGTLQVIDMLGRQLFTREVNSSLQIPNSSLTPGVYVLRLSNGSDLKTQKIVVE